MKRYPNKADRKAAWLSATEDMITKLKPSTAGKLEWDTLLHFYYEAERIARMVQVVRGAADPKSMMQRLCNDFAAALEAHGYKGAPQRKSDLKAILKAALAHPDYVVDGPGLQGMAKHARGFGKAPKAAHPGQADEVIEIKAIPDNPQVLGGFSDYQATQTAEFIRAVKTKQANLWVNCQAGISRSGAIVDILLMLGWTDLNSPLQEKRHPNPIVWHKLISHFPELKGAQYPFKDYQDWHDQTMDYMYSKWGNKKT